MKISVILLFLLFSNVCFSQDSIIDYNKLLSNIGKEIKLDTLKEGELILGNNKFEILKDSTLFLSEKLIINNQKLNLYNIILGNNEKLNFIDDFEFNIVYTFQNRKTTFIYIPLYIKGCNGRSCRYFSCLLVSLNKNKKKNKVYFFGNDECEEFFYFRYFRNNLVFIDLKSITNFSLKKEEDLFEYVIKLYGYDKKGNWNILKNRKNNEFFISFYAMDHFNKDNVILKDYNLPATQSLPTLSNNK